MNILVLLIGLIVTSCANVSQIDRGLLASRIMQFDPHPEESVFLNEVHTYREGSAGGSGKSVGGGCGCN